MEFLDFPLIVAKFAFASNKDISHIGIIDIDISRSQRGMDPSTL